MLMTIIMLFSTVAYAGNDDSKSKASNDDAYTVALNFILSNPQKSIPTEVEGDLYKNGVKSITIGYPHKFIVKDIKELKDEKDKTSAFLFAITDAENNPSGYVVVGADKKSYPIIEYSYDSKSFIEIATDEIISNEYKDKNINKKDVQYYYVGSYDYYAEINNEIYGLANGHYKKTDKSKIKDKKNNKEYELYSKEINNEWKALSKGFSGGSNPPTGQVITSPGGYETGYSSSSSDYCYNMGSSYFKDTDLGYGEICTPTAGTNLCLYWTRRVSSYSVLKKNSSWDDTFDRIFDLMETDVGDGTYWPNPARSGIKSYFRERGLNSTSAYYSTCTSTTHFNDYIKAEINNGRPILIALWEDDNYGNHTVLGLGYQRYKYNGVWSSHYIRINDGWSTSVNRYVHYETGRDSITRIRVTPAW